MLPILQPLSNGPAFLYTVVFDRLEDFVIDITGPADALCIDTMTPLLSRYLGSSPRQHMLAQLQTFLQTSEKPFAAAALGAAQQMQCDSFAELHSRVRSVQVPFPPGTIARDANRQVYSYGDDNAARVSFAFATAAPLTKAGLPRIRQLCHILSRRLLEILRGQASLVYSLNVDVAYLLPAPHPGYLEIVTKVTPTADSIADLCRLISVALHDICFVSGISYEVCGP